MRATVSKALYLAAKADGLAWRTMAETLAASLAKPPELMIEKPSLERKRRKSVVSEAIREQSGGDPRLMGYLRKRANDLKRDGKPDADIAAELSRWSTTEVPE